MQLLSITQMAHQHQQDLACWPWSMESPVVNWYAPFDPFPDLQERGNRRPLFLAMSDDGTRLAVALHYRFGNRVERKPGSISIRDGDTGSEIRRIDIPGFVFAIALTPDGSRIAVEYGEPTEPDAPRLRSGQAGVTIWDTSTGELVQTLPMLPWSLGHSQILWSPDGKRLLRQSFSTETIDDRPQFRGLIQIVDAASTDVVWQRESPSRTNPLRAWSWSPDGKLVVIFEAAESGLVAKPNVQLWDSDNRKGAGDPRPGSFSEHRFQHRL